MDYGTFQIAYNKGTDQTVQMAGWSMPSLLLVSNYKQVRQFSCSLQQTMSFVLVINFKMPTNVGHEKGFITAGPSLQ